MNEEEKNEYIRERVRRRVDALKGTGTGMSMSNRLDGIKQKRVLFVESREKYNLLNVRRRVEKVRKKDGEVF